MSLSIILFNPQIPQNTGNIGRLCAITRSNLHLIHPLGFKITDKHLKRSGMDYWKSLSLHEHSNWANFQESSQKPNRLWLLTTKATKAIWEAKFEDFDGLVFGNETNGAPDYVHRYVGPEFRITIPQFNSDLRSLNLSSSAAIAVYEALRQINCQRVIE